MKTSTEVCTAAPRQTFHEVRAQTANAIEWILVDILNLVLFIAFILNVPGCCSTAAYVK